MILPIQQPPVVSPTSAAVAAVNPIVTIQAIGSSAAIAEGGGGANPLASLANGTTVEGFVVNRDAQNNPILRTAVGDLRVTSEVFLKTGSEVIIRVDNTVATLARILTVDGLTPQDYSNQTQAARAGITKDTISASSLQPLLGNAAATQTKAGAPVVNPVLQAVVLQGQPTATNPSLLATALAASQSGPVQALAQLSQLRAGTPIRLTVLDIRLPPLPVSLGSLPQSTKLDGLLPAARAPTPQAPQQAVPAITNPPVQTAESELAPLQALVSQKTVVSAALQPTKTIQPPLTGLTQSTTNAASPAASAERPALTPAAANQISASVIGHDADGANILHTPFATLKVYTPQPLPTGTTLLVSAQVETNTTLITPPSVAEQQLASIVPKGDKAIDDVLAWMLMSHPDAARELQQRLPNVSRNFTSGLLFLIAAMKGGESSEIIGRRALRMLEAGAPDLLARLRAEVGQMQASIADSPLMHWTLYPLSMMVGQDMHHARLYVGKDPDSNESAGDASRGQRFVLEVELSQLGPMQFDGFVRSTEGKKSFDLMVRSAQPLEVLFVQEIRAIFDSCAAITGLKGRLIFQEGNQHFIRPMADSKPRSGGDGGNTILA